MGYNVVRFIFNAVRIKYDINTDKIVLNTIELEVEFFIFKNDDR